MACVNSLAGSPQRYQKNMSPEIQSALKAFNEIILKGVPHLLRQNETSFLSFMCMATAIDSLAGYRYPVGGSGKRFKDFLKDYFPAAYTAHIDNLWLFRCRLLHNFSPAYFTLVHSKTALHLTQSNIGDTVLSDKGLFRDLELATHKFFQELRRTPARQADMATRLRNVAEGGGIHVEG